MIICPSCGPEKEWKQLRRHPMDPAKDEFLCLGCGLEFTRYAIPNATILLKHGQHIGHFEEWEFWQLNGIAYNVNVHTGEVQPSTEKAVNPSMKNDTIQPGALDELTRLCSWCQRKIADRGQAYGPEYKATVGENVTHGICKECLRKVLTPTE